VQVDIKQIPLTRDWRKLKQRHPHWQAKVNLETEARKQGFKTVVVFPGIFTSDVFGVRVAYLSMLVPKLTESVILLQAHCTHHHLYS